MCTTPTNHPPSNQPTESQSTLYLLYESAAGYALLQSTTEDEANASADSVQVAMADVGRFGKLVKLVAFAPFAGAAAALENAKATSDDKCHNDLKAFLEANLKKSKKTDLRVGVQSPGLGKAITAATGLPCAANDHVGELLRGVRTHLPVFVKGLGEGDLFRSQLGLAHAFSRDRVKFNVKRVDNMIVQAIALLDTLDKDINTLVMRVREWYGYAFPELGRVVADHYQYSRVCLAVGDKSALGDADVERLAPLLGDDEERAKEVVEAARMSMGQDVSPVDLANIEAFAKRVIGLAEYRQSLGVYLKERMAAVAPNLSALIGETVGARLIAHAGSLVNLAKYPASTVQILGAEKALFRALKTKGNTPKYGLIFHSSFIGRAKQRNKGRISRYLANKCSIAARIDAFLDVQTSAFGDKLREQVEDRLRFYEEGVAPAKNATAMAQAMATAAAEGAVGGSGGGGGA